MIMITLFTIALTIPLTILRLLLAGFRALFGRPGTSHGRRAVAAMLLLRLASLAALSLLVWEVFCGPRRVTVEALPRTDVAEVVVLEDRSASMDLPGTSGHEGGGKAATRAELAGSIWEDVLERSASLEPGRVRLQRYLFAESLVPAAAVLSGEPGAAPRRDGSNLARAVSTILSRESLRSLLIVSDGISTDGQLAPHILDWAANRRVALHAISSACPGVASFDRAIADVDFEDRNPVSITAKVLCSGADARPLHILLAVDGEPSAELERMPRQAQEVSFRLPRLRNGWHSFRVEVSPVAGEATGRNNRFHGAFRVDDRARVLLVHDRPRPENVHLARFLRRRFEDAFLSMPLRALASTHEKLDAFSVIILADIAPRSIPEECRRLWFSGQQAVLLLGGEQLQPWLDARLPAFPLDGVGPSERLDGRGQVLRVASPAVREALGESEVKLELDWLPAARLRAGSVALYSVRTRRGATLPLLVSNRIDRPSFSVLLTDSTWRWAMHPDEAVRRDHARFWSTCLRWLSRGDDELDGLVLKLEPGQGVGDEIRGSVTVRSGTGSPGQSDELRDCRVEIASEGPAGSRTIRTVPDSGRQAFRYRRRAVAPDSEVLWLRALATLQGRELRSERVPVAFNRYARELSRVLPDATTLQQLGGQGRGRFAWYPDRSGVIDSLFRDTAAPGVTRVVRKRDSARELSLAAIAVLFLAMEWLIERGRHARRSP